MKLVKETTAVRGKSRLGLFPQIYTEIRFPFLTLQGVWQAALLSRISLNSTNLSPIWKGVNQMNMNQFLSHEWFHTALYLPSKVMEVNFDSTLLTGSWDHFKYTFDIFLNVLLTLSKKLSLKTRRNNIGPFCKIMAFRHLCLSRHQEWYPV